MNEPGLAQIAPELVEMLRRSSSHARRQIVERACTLVIDRSGLTDPRIIQAIEALRHEDPPDMSLRGQVDALTEKLDEIAWDLQEGIEGGVASKRDYETAFAKARASAAVGFAMEDSLSSAFDALYEAYYAIDGDKDEFVRNLLRR